jgi:hypothetical protein
MSGQHTGQTSGLPDVGGITFNWDFCQTFLARNKPKKGSSPKKRALATLSAERIIVTLMDHGTTGFLSKCQTFHAAPMLHKICARGTLDVIAAGFIHVSPGLRSGGFCRWVTQLFFVRAFGDANLLLDSDKITFACIQQSSAEQNIKPLSLSSFSLSRSLLFSLLRSLIRCLRELPFLPPPASTYWGQRCVLAVAKGVYVETREIIPTWYVNRLPKSSITLQEKK